MVANEFSVRREAWLFGPARELDPEEVDNLVGDWFKKVRSYVRVRARVHAAH